ncbi:MAG: cytidylate kinase-like family protein [Deltaproteobacteria bacterium]|nr:MAG: cytidylate kinase-like family protein [Deltaproteobacteria bacterium]
MPIIAISRSSYLHGKKIAEGVATKLGYTCISQEELLDDSQEFNLPDIKLIWDLLFILDQAMFWQYRYISYIRALLIRNLQKDNVVFHGFCGHVFLKELDHVLNVKITADIEDRAKLIMEHDGITRKETFSFIKTIDSKRKRWCQKLYKVDIQNISQYDITINISKFPHDKAVDIICKIVKLNRFQTTPESQKTMNELLIAAEAGASLNSDYKAERTGFLSCAMEV